MLANAPPLPTVNEIVRRVTDKKVTNGKILHEKVNPALGIEIYCENELSTNYISFGVGYC